jgi:hypothetical protein
MLVFKCNPTVDLIFITFQFGSVNESMFITRYQICLPESQ